MKPWRRARKAHENPVGLLAFPAGTNTNAKPSQSKKPIRKKEIKTDRKKRSLRQNKRMQNRKKDTADSKSPAGETLKPSPPHESTSTPSLHPYRQGQIQYRNPEVQARFRYTEMRNQSGISSFGLTNKECMPSFAVSFIQHIATRQIHARCAGNLSMAI